MVTGVVVVIAVPLVLVEKEVEKAFGKDQDRMLL
jgi:hypothetical protein